MRLSSISSQDSGFTSQDTLFLPRPSSPSSRMKVIENTSEIDSKESKHVRFIKMFSKIDELFILM